MQLVFVHGWSVTSTDTYGNLPRALANAAAGAGLSLDIQHIYLGRYISFNDTVTMDDIARAMDRALRDLPGNSDTQIAPFSCKNKVLAQGYWRIKQISHKKTNIR